MVQNFPETVVITGASSGIGLASAKRFLAGGAKVINISRRVCPDSGILSIQADMLSDDWRKTVSAALDNVLVPGGSLCLIHNAAMLVNDTVANVDPAVFRSLLELNVSVPMELTAMLLPIMGAGSSVLFVGSTLSEKAVPGVLSYATSKHALIGLMRSCAQDLAGRSIHTAAVCPGFTDTEMVRAHVPDNAVLQAIGANNGFGRLVEPDEIAASIEFCARNPVINGSVIHANLGQLES